MQSQTAGPLAFGFPSLHEHIRPPQMFRLPPVSLGEGAVAVKSFWFFLTSGLDQHLFENVISLLRFLFVCEVLGGVKRAYRGIECLSSTVTDQLFALIIKT